MFNQFNLNCSQEEFYEELEFSLPFQYKRSASNDIFGAPFNNFNLTFNQPTEKNRNLVINFDENSSTSNSQEKVTKSKTLKIFKKKEKKKRVRGQCDYKKNICGYITKKILREFTGPVYAERVSKLCTKHECSYPMAKSYYLSQIQRVTGPSHIPPLVIAENEGEIGIKNAFREFFLWFLKERYIRYLLLEGKMDQKGIYLRYKNQTLSQILKQSQQKL